MHSLEDSGKYYLYRHIRLDTNQVFYIGIGTKNKCDLKYGYYIRASIKNNRNKWWKNIVNQTEYKVQVLMESDNYEFIKQKEIEFIALYGRRDLNKGTLVNLTDGGDGAKKVIKTNKIKIYQFDLDGNFIKEWESITEASEEYSIPRPRMTRTLRYNSKGRCRKIHNFIFQYEPIFINKDNSCYKKPHFHKKIALYHEDGHLIKEWESVKSCSQELSIWSSTIKDNIDGKFYNGKNIKKYYRFKYI